MAVISRFIPILTFQMKSEKDFAVRITKQYGVAVIPVSAFYQDEINHNVVRFCFAKKESTLENAAKRLINIEPVI